MNWDDPAERVALLERVGPIEYNRQHAENMRARVVSRVNGYDIRLTSSRFGRLYAVSGTRSAFLTQEQAETYARKLSLGGA